MKKCVSCEKGNYSNVKVRNYKYLTPMGFIIIESESKFLKCNNCGQTLIPGETIKKWNHLILKGLAAKEGLINPKELQFILSTLPYEQKEIAEAMGKEKSTLTHYKNGKNPIDRLFDYALRNVILDFLDGSSKTLDHLKEAFKFAGEKTLKKVHSR